MIEGVWYLTHRGSTVAELHVHEVDQPWLQARVVRRAGFSEVEGLFMEELRLLNTCGAEAPEWEAAWQRVQDQTRLLYPDGQPVLEYLLHLDGDEAWWRWSDEPFEDGP